jgi:TetR/AcrR family acrAB operon transcriptional repressor
MRRTKEEAEKTKGQIILAAIKVMNRMGISSTRFEDIAAEADVSRGAIYHYFKNKNEILFAIHDQNKKKIHELFNKHVEKDTDPLISLKKGLLEIFARFEEDDEFRMVEELFLKVEFTSLIKEDSELNKLFEKDKDETICKMLELVKKGQECGSFRKDIEAENLGYALISFYIGFTTMWFMQLRQFSIKDKASDYIDILFHGIIK